MSTGPNEHEKKAIDDVKSDSDGETHTTKNVNLHSLPDWAQTGWTTRFLHTLYNAINASNSPLEDFQANSQNFETVVNAIVKYAYPIINYKVTRRDAIFIMVSNDCLPKRSQALI